MKLEFEVDQAKIIEIVEHLIAEGIYKKYGQEEREAKYGVRSGVDKAIKEYIYKNKDAIIERVVDRATTEIVKKGLPKLLESLGK